MAATETAASRDQVTFLWKESAAAAASQALRRGGGGLAAAQPDSEEGKARRRSVGRRGGGPSSRWRLPATALTVPAVFLARFQGLCLARFFPGLRGREQAGVAQPEPPLPTRCSHGATSPRSEEG